MSVTSDTNGYIYLLVLREFRKNKESIVKFGCSKNIINRFGQYPKGSLLIYTQYVQSYIETEKVVLKVLRENYIPRKDIGSEYFEGCVSNIIKTIQDTITNGILDIFSDAYNTCDEPIEPAVVLAVASKKDPNLMIQAFMTDNKPKYNNTITKTSDVYADFLQWCHQEDIKKELSYKRFVSDIKSMYGLKIKHYNFEDGVEEAFDFEGIAESKPPHIMKFEDYVKSKVQKDANSWFSLKDFKKDYMASGHITLKPLAIKEALERILDTKSIPSLSRNYKHQRNTFMGYKLLEITDSNIIEFL